jgi:hyaluronan synthase
METKTIIELLIIYFPIGAIGLWRWSVWGIKKMVGRFYRPIENNGFTATLSMVIPVYNEEPDLFRRALKSWDDNQPNEIIAVIDHSDTVCIDIFKKFQKTAKAETVLIVTEKPGKRAALVDGIKVSKYDIIALIDSDTIWQDNIKEKLLWPFKDQRIGGVSPRQIVSTPDTIARKLFDIHLDQRYNDETRFLAVVANALTCLSGRTAVYRREAVYDICEELNSETFLGARCVSGDDKCLTRLIQERRWLVRYQHTAIVMTPGEAKLKTLLKQQMRWARNSYRSDIKSLASTWIWKYEIFLAFHMLDRFTQAFTLLLGPIFLVFSIVWGYWVGAAVLLVWWHVSRAMKLIPHFKRHPSHIFILPVYVGITYYLALLKIYAKLTIHKSGWITRWDKNRMDGGQFRVMRMIKAATPYVALVGIVVSLAYVVWRYQEKVAAPLLSQHEEAQESVGVGDSWDSKNNKTFTDNTAKKLPALSYQIKEGDSLARIARTYGVSIDALVRVNNIAPMQASLIYPQQKLTITPQILSQYTKPSLAEYGGTPKVSLMDGIVTISGSGAMVLLEDISHALGVEALLPLEAKDDSRRSSWQLQRPITVGPGVALVIKDSVLSIPEGSYLQNSGGRIFIIDSQLHVGSGHSYIVSKSGRLDIVDSEVIRPQEIATSTPEPVILWQKSEDGFSGGVLENAVFRGPGVNFDSREADFVLVDHLYFDTESRALLGETTGTLSGQVKIEHLDTL